GGRPRLPPDADHDRRDAAQPARPAARGALTMQRHNRWLTRDAIVVYAFLFAPIVILILFSFNDSRRNFAWRGFTLDWYPRLFDNEDLLDALGGTLQVATMAVIGSVSLGTLLGLVITRLFRRRRGGAETLLLLPMVTPE